MEKTEDIINFLLQIWEAINKNAILSGLFLLLIGGICGNYFSQRKKIIQKYRLKKANKLLDKGYDDRAKEMYSKILMENKDDELLLSDARVGRAKIYLYTKIIDLDRAIENANIAIKLNEENGEAYIVRGRAYSLKNDSILAIKDFTEAMEHVMEKKEVAYIYRGIEYSIQKDYNTAIFNFNEALKLKHNSADALINRGYVYSKKNDYDSAIKDYEQVLKTKKRKVDALINRGNAYSEKGENEKALIDYSKVIKIKPTLAYTMFNNRGLIYSKNSKTFDQAIEEYSMAIKKNSNYSDAYYNRGNIFSKTGEIDKAIDDFTSTIKLDSDPLAYNNRALAYLRKRDYEKAIEDNTTVINLLPNCSFAYYNRGNTYDDKGDLINAIEDYSRAIAIDENYAMAYNNRGFSYLKMQDYDKAIANFSKAISLGLHHFIVYKNRSLAYQVKGDMQRANEDHKIAQRLLLSQYN